MRRTVLLPVFALTSALAISACAPMPAASPVAAPPPPGPCNAAAASWAIGHAVDQALVNRVLHDTGSRTARVIEPGEAVTLDYVRERVNIKVNERGAIYSITCG